MAPLAPLAPLASPLDKIRDKVKKKAPWIIQQQDFFLSFEPRTPPRKYVSGETHLYLGRQYRLKVASGKKEVKLHGGYIHILLPDPNPKSVEKELRAWYAKRAKKHFSALFEECLPVARKISSNIPSLQMRWMNKRWGSCDRNGTIHLNTELIKAPRACIEYVIIHEMCHMKHLNHSAAFWQELEKVMPQWRKVKKRLENVMV